MKKALRSFIVLVALSAMFANLCGMEGREDVERRIWLSPENYKVSRDEAYKWLNKCFYPFIDGESLEQRLVLFLGCIDTGYKRGNRYVQGSLTLYDGCAGAAPGLYLMLALVIMEVGDIPREDATQRCVQRSLMMQLCNDLTKLFSGRCSGRYCEMVNFLLAHPEQMITFVKGWIEKKKREMECEMGEDEAETLLLDDFEKAIEALCYAEEMKNRRSESDPQDNVGCLAAVVTKHSVFAQRLITDEPRKTPVAPLSRLKNRLAREEMLYVMGMLCDDTWEHYMCTDSSMRWLWNCLGEEGCVVRLFDNGGLIDTLVDFEESASVRERAQFLVNSRDGYGMRGLLGALMECNTPVAVVANDFEITEWKGVLKLVHFDQGVMCEAMPKRNCVHQVFFTSPEFAPYYLRILKRFISAQDAFFRNLPRGGRDFRVASDPQKFGHFVIFFLYRNADFIRKMCDQWLSDSIKDHLGRKFPEAARYI